MQDFFSTLLLNFVPLFIAMDAIGNLPIIISLSEDSTHEERHRMINIATLTAALVGLVFLFFGKLILSLMGIEVGAFAIAGGIILLVLSIRYMTSGHMFEVIKGEMTAIVPIGTPLITGPATITTLLILAGEYDIYYVLIAFSLNILIGWLVFLASERLVGFMGQGGIKAISRVFNLLLAALAVNMIIRGLVLIGVLKV